MRPQGGAHSLIQPAAWLPVGLFEARDDVLADFLDFAGTRTWVVNKRNLAVVSELADRLANVS